MPPPVSPHPDSGLGATTFTHLYFVQRCKMHIMHRRDTACNEGYWEPIKLNGWPICCWWLAFAYKWTHCCKYILHGGH